MLISIQGAPRRVLGLLIAVLLPALLDAQTPTISANVIPLPRRVTAGAGEWRPAARIPITLSAPRNEELKSLGALAAQIVEQELGARPILDAATSRKPGGIHLRLEAAPANAPTGAAAGESYQLVVSAGGVEVTAASGVGLFYGLQTLRQLIVAREIAPGTGARVAGVSIDDAPRFPYRGLHLDVGRHFQPVEFIKRYIHLMARYKLNTFHWHLTEDQGWRIQIAKYPRLTEVGGCRAETMVEKRFEPYVGDGVRYCGFYTQDQVREVVAYAKAHYVTVIPEIEMPGHSVAALSAYPELACTPGPFAVRTTWGVDANIFCPGEPTFTFLENVLTEVMALFPSRYIHIGGDEAPKDRWRASALAQEVIRREGLKDEHELQSYFIRRIESFLNANGRRLIGWDEILEGGLAPQATVMSWRGTSGGVDAARQGHDVIMTPTSHMYFDFYQGDPRFEPLAIGGNLPLEQVYAYEPIPPELTEAEAHHVLGAQANVWTEYLKTAAAVEYQAYPRVLALAEVVWSERAARDWEGFVSRLPFALRGLDALKVNYRLPNVAGLEGNQLTLEPSLTIRLRAAIAGAEIRYTTDGSDPTQASALYRDAFELPVTEAGVWVTARAFTPDGKSSPPRAATFTRTTYRDGEAIDAASLDAGWRYAYYEAAITRAGGLDSLAPTREGIATDVTRRGDERPEQYAIRLSGHLRVPADGMYSFALTSDDGSTMTIGDRMVVDNDGFHGTAERRGMVALRAGLHPVTVRFFQGGGGAALSLRYRVGNGEWTNVPAEWLVHRR